MNSPAQSMPSNYCTDPVEAARLLDAHVREIVRWHFSPQIGTPFWLDWAKKSGWNPAEQVQGFADLQRFPHFEDEWLQIGRAHV